MGKRLEFRRRDRRIVKGAVTIDVARCEIRIDLVAMHAEQRRRAALLAMKRERPRDLEK